MSKIFSFPFLIAAASGVTMALQGALNSQLYQKTSLLAATLVIHLIGSVVSLAAVLFSRSSFFSFSWQTVPWYYYTRGVLSVFIIALVALSIPKVGMCNATTAIIIGQVSAALIIDHLGLFGSKSLPWSIWQLLGLILFAGGAKLLFR